MITCKFLLFSFRHCLKVLIQNFFFIVNFNVFINFIQIFNDNILIFILLFFFILNMLNLSNRNFLCISMTVDKVENIRQFFVMTDFNQSISFIKH